MEKEVKTPKSQLNWQAKYDKEKMQQIGIKCTIAEKELYKKAAEKHGLKLATFLRYCAKYCIDNNIDISNVTPEK